MNHKNLKSKIKNKINRYTIFSNPLKLDENRLSAQQQE